MNTSLRGSRCAFVTYLGGTRTGLLAIRASCAAVAATVVAVLALAPPAVASPLLGSPSKLTLSTPVGTTTEATLTFTNASATAVELTGAFLTYKPFLTPGQVNALNSFTTDCGLRVLASGESCSYTIVFQPGVLDDPDPDPDPDPGTVFRGRFVQETDHGSEVVHFTATAT